MSTADTLVNKLWSYCDVLRPLHPPRLQREVQVSCAGRGPTADLDEFVACYHPENRQKRKATWSPEKPDGRWRAYEYGELVARDKCSLDLFWLKDESLLDADSLPDPDEIAAEIADDLRAALEQIEEILGDLQRPKA